MALGGVFHSQRKRDPHQPLASLISDTDHKEALVAVGELFLGDIGQAFWASPLAASRSSSSSPVSSGVKRSPSWMSK